MVFSRKTDVRSITYYRRDLLYRNRRDYILHCVTLCDIHLLIIKCLILYFITFAASVNIFFYHFAEQLVNSSLSLSNL